MCKLRRTPCISQKRCISGESLIKQSRCTSYNNYPKKVASIGAFKNNIVFIVHIQRHFIYTLFYLYILHKKYSEFLTKIQNTCLIINIYFVAFKIDSTRHNTHMPMLNAVFKTLFKRRRRYCSELIL